MLLLLLLPFSKSFEQTAEAVAVDGAQPKRHHAPVPVFEQSSSRWKRWNKKERVEEESSKVKKIEDCCYGVGGVHYREPPQHTQHDTHLQLA